MVGNLAEFIEKLHAELADSESAPEVQLPFCIEAS